MESALFPTTTATTATQSEWQQHRWYGHEETELGKKVDEDNQQTTVAIHENIFCNFINFIFQAARGLLRVRCNSSRRRHLPP
jgi:hypothetical protein